MQPVFAADYFAAEEPGSLVVQVVHCSHYPGAEVAEQSY